MNNFITMTRGVQNKDEAITPEKTLYVHKLISDNRLDNTEDEGKFRDQNDVHVVNHSSRKIVHLPPPKSELEGLICNLCVFFNSETDNFIFPIVKGCRIHFMVSWIYPFIDGNGRSARAIFYGFMVKNVDWLTQYLSISSIIKDTKSQCERAYLYSEDDENDLGYIITNHLETIEKVHNALKEYTSTKQKEKFQSAKVMKILHVNNRMAQVLKVINDDSERVLYSKEIITRFNISSYTARTDLKSLNDLGFLAILKNKKKKQNFIRSTKFEEKPETI